MDPVVATIVMRFVERLLVVGGGILAVYCGYRLFLAMPSRERGAGKLELPGGVSIHLSRIGPGVFFSLFGAVILSLSFHYSVSVNVPSEAARLAGGHNGAVSFQGLAVLPEPERAPDAVLRRLPDEADLFAVETSIRRLNLAAQSLDPALDPFARGDIERALRTARLKLMENVWDESRWGPWSTFLHWVEHGEPMPAPDAVAAAVAIYRAAP